MADQGEQQTVSVIEFGPVELAMAKVGKLLDLCSPEVLTCDGISDLAIAGSDTRGVKPGVFKNLHQRPGSGDLAWLQLKAAFDGHGTEGFDRAA